MSIVETSWQQFLAPDSEVPPDVFFLVKREDGDGDDSSRPIGAHRAFLAGVSPVFRKMLYGPLKEGEEIEVKFTTSEAFNTMISYIYKPPSSGYFSLVPNFREPDKFFLGPVSLSDDEEQENSDDEMNPDHRSRIHCPQKFFDLLDLAERYQILNMKQELTSYAFGTLAITNDNVIFTAQVAKNYQQIFEDVSTKLLAKCLKFLLKKTGFRTGDIWTRFWALVNNTGDPEEQLRECVAFHERLAGTPFADLTVSHALIKETLDKVGGNSYDQCLYLACSGDHVRWTT